MKQLGIAIWFVALAGFVGQLFQAPKSETNVVFLGIALFVYLPMLIYNWLWGHQRGHIVHFIGIVVAAWMSILLYFRRSIPEILLGIGIGAALLLLFLALRKYRPGIMADFRNRIRRDHFSRKG